MTASSSMDARKYKTGRIFERASETGRMVQPLRSSSEPMSDEISSMSLSRLILEMMDLTGPLYLSSFLGAPCSFADTRSLDRPANELFCVAVSRWELLLDISGLTRYFLLLSTGVIT